MSCLTVFLDDETSKWVNQQADQNAIKPDDFVADHITSHARQRDQFRYRFDASAQETKVQAKQHPTTGRLTPNDIDFLLELIVVHFAHQYDITNEESRIVISSTAARTKTDLFTAALSRHEYYLKTKEPPEGTPDHG